MNFNTILSGETYQSRETFQNGTVVEWYCDNRYKTKTIRLPESSKLQKLGIDTISVTQYGQDNLCGKDFIGRRTINFSKDGKNLVGWQLLKNNGFDYLSCGDCQIIKTGKSEFISTGANNFLKALKKLFSGVR